MRDTYPISHSMMSYNKMRMSTNYFGISLANAYSILGDSLSTPMKMM